MLRSGVRSVEARRSRRDPGHGTRYDGRPRVHSTHSCLVEKGKPERFAEPDKRAVPRGCYEKLWRSDCELTRFAVAIHEGAQATPQFQELKIVENKLGLLKLSQSRRRWEARPTASAKNSASDTQERVLSSPFRRKLYRSRKEIQIDVDAWIETYNAERTHSGKTAMARPPCRPSSKARRWRTTSNWTGSDIPPIHNSLCVPVTVRSSLA